MPDRDFRIIFLSAAALIIAGQAIAALNRGINWDEFHHYDLVRRFADGNLSGPLQSIFVHYFKWMLALPGDVTDHIRAARLIMLGFEIGTVVALFGVSRRFASRNASAMIVLVYMSGGFVVNQGSSFRYDPQVTFVLMSALWILSAASLRPAAIMLFGLLAGLAPMITIKVVFYAPAFLGIAWLRLSESSRKHSMALRLLACVAASLIVFAALYYWHSGFVTTASVVRDAPVGNIVRSATSAGNVVFSEGFLPQGRALMYQAILGPLATLLVLSTVFGWRRLKLSGAKKVAMAGLMLPLLSVLAYRNSYAYFFVFLLPPVLAATAPAMEQFLLRFVGMAKIAALSVFLSCLLVLVTLPPDSMILQGQKKTISVAHELFPEPVTYFDFAGYLGDYQRALPFMISGWGLKAYLRNGRTAFIDAMERETIPLLILNHSVLEDAVKGTPDRQFLMPEDAEALRESYIEHWGRIWVAGRHIPAGREAIRFNNRVPGTYTLEGGEQIIDGVLREPGDVIELSRGLHSVGASRSRASTLRWGNHLALPEIDPPTTIPFSPLRFFP